jgi:hypothetical protein
MSLCSIRAAGKLLVVLGIATLLPTAARAADCPPVDDPPRRVVSDCPAVDPVGKAGLRIFRDRRTGGLRAPTPEEARALYASGGRGIESLEPLEIVVHPDGMRSADLKGAFDSELVVRRNADGSLVTACRTAGATAVKK